MNGGTKVVEAAAIGGVEQKHGGLRGNADRVQFAAWKQTHLGLHHGVHPRRDVEAVGANHRRAFQQGMHHQMGSVGAGAFDPETREARKFLTFGGAGGYRQAAGGQAIQLPPAHGPQIAGALKYQELVHHVRPVQGIAHPETAEEQAG